MYTSQPPPPPPPDEEEEEEKVQTTTATTTTPSTVKTEVAKPINTALSAEELEREQDKELMSNIKEKIQRKKEEKLRKEKEKEDIALKKVAEKEKQMREKLIQKKFEREKGLGTSSSSSPPVTPKARSPVVEESAEKFDMFATDVKLVKASASPKNLSRANSPKIVAKEKEEPVKEEPTKEASKCDHLISF